MPEFRSRPARSVRVPSCEPCRLSKLACNHARPTCSRCAGRGRANECEYRSNPFRRVRAAARQSTTRPVRPWSANPSPNSAVASHQNGQLTTYPNPGFQGSTSLGIILGAIEPDAFQNSSPNLSLQNGPSVEEISPTEDGAQEAHVLLLNSDPMIEEGVQVLEMFADALIDGTFRELFDDWSMHGLEAHPGSFLVPFFFETMTDVAIILRQHTNRRSGLFDLSRRLFDAGRVPVRVHEIMSVKDFATQHTGHKLRWESIGLVLAMVGIAATEIRGRHALCDTEQERHSLRRYLINAITRCASFCESLDYLNDIQIIFLYETFLFYSVYFGDQSFQTWRRLNEAICALFARGLHESLDKDQQAPFFLVQLRKQIFARIYASDISFAVFLGRPPRISQRYCDIHLPLDISQDACHLGGEALNEQLRQLDQNGWNIQGHISVYAVLRWSVTTSRIREDTLDAIIETKTGDMKQLIGDLRARLLEAWRELPAFLAVPAREVWNRDRRGEDIDRLYLFRLFYLQAAFLIEWTASIHDMADTESLYIIAGDLLSWVNEALIRRDRLTHTGSNSLAWRVTACGLPAAGALARCMTPDSALPSCRWQTATARAKVVGDLSILLGHMDYLHEPGDGNYKLFRQARSILNGVIASIVSPPEASRARTPPLAEFSISPLYGSAVEPSLLRPDFWIGLPGLAEFDFF